MPNLLNINIFFKEFQGEISIFYHPPGLFTR